MNCHDVRTLLEGPLVHELPPARAALLEAHLAACSACREEEASLRRLRLATARLPRSLEPERDLWPELAGRLAARPRRLSARPWAATSAGWWTRQAAAAVVFMCLGGAVTQLWLGGRAAAPAAGPARAASPTVPAAAGPAPAIVAAEAEFLAVKASLWRAAFNHHDQLSPVTVDVVERNLRIIDAAIAELRQALEQDPTNAQLASLLLASHRQEINLLQRLATGSSKRS